MNSFFKGESLRILYRATDAATGNPINLRDGWELAVYVYANAQKMTASQYEPVYKSDSEFYIYLSPEDTTELGRAGSPAEVYTQVHMRLGEDTRIGKGILGVIQDPATAPAACGQAVAGANTCAANMYLDTTGVTYCLNLGCFTAPTIWGQILGDITDQADLAEALAGIGGDIEAETAARIAADEAIIASIPTDTADLTNGAGYQTRTDVEGYTAPKTHVGSIGVAQHGLATGAQAGFSNYNFTSALNQKVQDALTALMVLSGTGVNVVRNPDGTITINASVDSEIFLVVDVLPAVGQPNKIYLVPSTSPHGGDIFTEYAWINGAWELLGSVSVDLSNYYTKTESDQRFASMSDLEQVAESIPVNHNDLDGRDVANSHPQEAITNLTTKRIFGVPFGGSNDNVSGDVTANTVILTDSGSGSAHVNGSAAIINVVNTASGGSLRFVPNNNSFSSNSNIRLLNATLRPEGNNGASLGSTSVYWNYGYITNVYTKALNLDGVTLDRDGLYNSMIAQSLFTDTGTDNVIVLTIPGYDFHTVGLPITFIKNLTTTSSGVNININGLGTVPVRGYGTFNTMAGFMRGKGVYTIIYDGSGFVVDNYAYYVNYAALLYSTRTIFGKSFNGGANVTGDATVAGLIAETGTDIINHTGGNAYRMLDENNYADIIPVGGGDTLYMSTGTATNIILTVPGVTELKDGDSFKFRMNVSSTGTSTMGVTINDIPTIYLKRYGTTPLVAGDVQMGGIYTITYIEDENVFRLNNFTYRSLYANESTNTTGYSLYSQYGADSYMGTYYVGAVETTDKWLPIGTITRAYSGSYLGGSCIQQKINMYEVVRQSDAVDLEDFEIKCVVSLPAYANAVTFNTTIPGIKLMVKGYRKETELSDIAAVITTATTGTKIITLYVRAHVADKIFNVNPLNATGSSFAGALNTNGRGRSSGYIYFTTSNNLTPLASLPAPAQGTIVTAVTGDW